MTLTADIPGDSISILGRQGIITAETAAPDKVLIDVDLATLPGLEVDGSNQLKAKVDGTTIQINGSGQLESLLTPVSNLTDLADVSLTTPLSDNQLLVFDGTNWTDKTASLTGSTGTPVQSTTALSDITITTGSVAAASHNHNLTTKSAALQTHTHPIAPGSAYYTDPPTQAGVSVLDSIGDASGTVAGTVNSVSKTTTTVNSTSHTHPNTGLSISIT